MKKKKERKVKLKLIEGNPDAGKENAPKIEPNPPIYIKAAVMGSKWPDLALVDYINYEEIDMETVCEVLNIQPHVLRYWESEFLTIVSNKYPNGKRTYSINNFAKLTELKWLLYNEGVSIDEARLKLLDFIQLYRL